MTCPFDTLPTPFDPFPTPLDTSRHRQTLYNAGSVRRVPPSVLIAPAVPIGRARPPQRTREKKRVCPPDFYFFSAALGPGEGAPASSTRSNITCRARGMGERAGGPRGKANKHNRETPKTRQAGSSTPFIKLQPFHTRDRPSMPT